MSPRKLAHELGISRRSIQKVLKNDLEFHVYKIQNELLVTNEHKKSTQLFDTAKLPKRRHDEILLIWVVNRLEADIKGVNWENT